MRGVPHYRLTWRSQRSARVLGGRLGPEAGATQPLPLPRVGGQLWVRWDYEAVGTRICRCDVTRVDSTRLCDDGAQAGDKKVFVTYDGGERDTHIWRAPGQLHAFLPRGGIGARLDASDAPPEESGMCADSDDEWDVDAQRGRACTADEGELSDAEETAAEREHEELMQRHVDGLGARSSSPEAPLSNYEEQRLATIQRNEWVLKALFSSS